MEKIAKELKNSDYFYNRINELTIENNELHARIKELEDIINTMKEDYRYREERIFYGY